MNDINLRSRQSWKEIAIRTAFVLVTVTLVVWFMPREQQQTFSFEQGKVWNYPDLTAMFDFPVFKSQAVIDAERKDSLEKYKPCYQYYASVKQQKLHEFREATGMTSRSFTFNYLRMVVAKLDTVYERGIIDDRKPLNIPSGQFLQMQGVREIGKKSCSQVMTPREAYEYIVNSSDLRYFGDIINHLNLNNYLVPNLSYDSRLSDSLRNSLINSVVPSTGIVQAGEKIIRTGEKIDQASYMKLTSYMQKLQQQNSLTKRVPMNILGEIIYVLLIIVGFTWYLGTYRKDYFENIRSACMIYVLVILFSILASVLVDHSMMHVYILPFAIVPIYIRIFMDSRTAFMAHITVILICASILHYPLEFIAVELAMGLTAIFMLHELSSRSQLFWTATVTIIAGVAMRMALYMIRHQDMDAFNVWELYYLLISGVLIFCSYPLVYVIEKVFGFLSEITLIELSDTNKELLRTMSEVAPGTFQHSVMVGNLAAEVARKIGANVQLVRTGALYHDIGKTQNPIYFTENQSGGISPHDHLNYMESAQMIISHVTEGIRLANKHHLPSQIRDLIATHHGQGKAKYFYIKYKNEHPDEPVDDLLFTYPGPNPFTKEQAILMMADAVEAASRSLPDYTEHSIRTLVERIIDSQVSEGFFRDCPITFRDIQYAKTVLIEKLKTIYHTRISYPEEKK